MSEGLTMPIDPYPTPTILQPSTQPQKKQKPRKPKRKDTQVPQPSDSTDNVVDEDVHKELGDNLVRAATTVVPKELIQVVVPGAKKPWGILLLKRGLRMHLNFLMIHCSQEGRIDDIDTDENITLVNVHDDVDDEMFDVNDLGGEEVFVAGQNEEVVDAAQVNTTATTVTLTTEEITLAQALEALKTSKPKVKGIFFHEPGKSTTTTTISSQQSQDKGKGIMIEEPVKPKKKDQIRLDEETALKLQAEFDEEERLAREKAEKEKEANITLIEE
ncbi:hypothetical protein Tco_1098879 [Tanacetum coccineum]